MEIAFTGLGDMAPHMARNLRVHRLDAPVSSMAKASYSDAAGGMTPVLLHEDITGIALRFPAVTAHVA